MYYFDCAAAKKPRVSSKQAYLHALDHQWSNPASVHQLSQNLVKDLESAYHSLALLYSAKPEATVVFGSSIQEMIAQVIQGVYNEQSRQNGKNHYLCSCLDEAPIILNFEKLSPLGCSHDLIQATPSGQIDLEALKNAIHPRTALIALGWANSLTGVIQPIEQIAQIAKDKQIPLLLDASATQGLYELNLAQLEPDFVCISGNSLGAPAGSASCWYQKSQTFDPLLICGHDWMHSSSCNPPALLAMADAASKTLAERDEAVWKLAQLRLHFENQLKQRVGAKVLFEDSERLVCVSAIAFEGIHAEHLAWHLNRKMVCTSFGGGMRQQLHYLLKACQVPALLHHSTLSFSFDLNMNQGFMDEALDLIVESCHQVKAMHHF